MYYCNQKSEKIVKSLVKEINDFITNYKKFETFFLNFITFADVNKVKKLKRTEVIKKTKTLLSNIFQFSPQPVGMASSFLRIWLGKKSGKSFSREYNIVLCFSSFRF